MPFLVERRQDPVAVERILRLLPEWFGIQAAIDTYVRNAASFPSYLAVDPEGTVVGIALLETHFAGSAELHLIAVDPGMHRKGVGRAIVAAIESDLHAEGAQLLQVHTVGPSWPDDGYARTREFYFGLGFVPLQEFHGINWGGPTLVLVKVLQGPDHRGKLARSDVTIDDDRIRVATWTFGESGASTGAHRHEFDYVVVPVTGGEFTVTAADGSVRTMTQVAGSPYTGSAGTSHEVANTVGAHAVFVEVELKQ